MPELVQDEEGANRGKDQPRRRRGVIPGRQGEQEGAVPGRQRAIQPKESLVMNKLKVISSDKSRYKPGCKNRAVDKRAEALPQEYIGKAQEADRKYNGVQPGVIGGVKQKLISLGEVRGVVAGNFGEVS